MHACVQETRLMGLRPQGGEDSEEEELSDEAMMALDESLSSLFAEQKLRIQAQRDEKNKLQKEKTLRRDFQIRVSQQSCGRGPAQPISAPAPQQADLTSTPRC